MALLAFAGCGIITHGTSQGIVCKTTPAGAVVKSADGTTCTTPCTFTLKRKKDDLLTIEREGYETATLSVRSVLSASSAVNVLLPGGFVCWGIDIVSGAGYHLIPDRVDVKLKPAEGGWTIMPLPGGVGRYSGRDHPAQPSPVDPRDGLDAASRARKGTTLSDAPVTLSAALISGHKEEH